MKPRFRDAALASLITQVETELDKALGGLNGWAENVLSGEQHRIAELRNAWRQQANHIRELDRLLNQTATETQASALQHPGTPQPTVTPVTDVLNQQQWTEPSPSDARIDDGNAIPSRILEHQRSRSENLVKLREVRRQMYDDLMSSLAWVRELVTMIHLAKYTGAPASQALDLVRQIAAAVECLSQFNRLT